jgi:hypothetical protein
MKWHERLELGCAAFLVIFPLALSIYGGVIFILDALGRF